MGWAQGRDTPLTEGWKSAQAAKWSTAMRFYRARNAVKSCLPVGVYEILRTLRKHTIGRLPDIEIYQACTRGRSGIEIGGPSALFETRLPLYEAIDSLDGVNFSGSTIWEGTIQEGKTFNFRPNRVGRQFVSDGTALDQIQSGFYDFVLSSNCLEHIANPIKALREWKRILKPNGCLILVLPKKESNFDHRRPYTSFNHLLDDFRNNTTEDDLTHLEEVLNLHDLSRDPKAGTVEQSRVRSQNNSQIRALHHHVFDLRLIRQMLEFCEFRVVSASIMSKC